MGWFELGKNRSEFGKFVEDTLGLTHEEMANICGVSRGTITRLCQNKACKPNMGTGNKIIRAIRRNFDVEVSSEDFW